VGERHIRAREAETAAIEAERQRQIEAAEAVETAATAENAGENRAETHPENQDRAAALAQPLIEA
jgi:hypothetical protein